MTPITKIRGKISKALGRRDQPLATGEFAHPLVRYRHSACGKIAANLGARDEFLAATQVPGTTRIVVGGALLPRLQSGFARAMNGIGPDGMWDEEDGFYYDVLRLPDGSSIRLKVRSMVALLPMCGEVAA